MLAVLSFRDKRRASMEDLTRMKLKAKNYFQNRPAGRWNDEIEL
jgi:hypothetical protein